MKIDRDRLFEMYSAEVDQICEDLDWKTQFSAREIVDLISTILEEYNDELIGE